MRRALVVVSSLLLAGLPAQHPSGFCLAPLFGDHMVMPADAKVPVHGRGPAGAPIRVQPSWGDAVETKVRGDGRFQVDLVTGARGAAGTLTVACGSELGTELLSCEDILFGDVWLASGQSNMEMPVGAVDGWLGVQDWQEEVANAQWPQLRVFKTQKQMSNLPLHDATGSWTVCTPATAARYSAVAYFFARGLLLRDKGPIGIVDSSWGGTVCEAWTSEQGLQAFPEFLAALIAQRRGADAKVQAAARELFWQAVDAARAELPAVEVELPERWSTQSLRDFDGVVSYRRELTLPASFVGQELFLELGAIDDMDTVFWRGERIAGSERDGVWNESRRYRVPAEVTAAGPFELRVRVVDTGGEGGFAGPAAAMQLRRVDGVGDSLALAGTWSRSLLVSMAGLPDWPKTQARPNRPAVLWNGMIAPLLPFPFTGVIWYQGESNRGRPDQYARLFPAMITDWRRAIGSELPFYFVQIAPYRYQKDGDELTPRLRAAQAAALELPGTGMAVTLDCGDPQDIHPRNKRPVGERLAALALQLHYGFGIDGRAPAPLSATLDDGVVVVGFSPGGLQERGDGGGFELGDADGRFVSTRGMASGDVLQLLVPSGFGPPTEVRYAWHAVPTCSLFGMNELPVAPFRIAIR